MKIRHNVRATNRTLGQISLSIEKSVLSESEVSTNFLN